MKLLKLTALASLYLALILYFSSCEKESEKRKANVFTKSDIAMTAAQVVPISSASTATGNLSVNYDKRNNTLTYTLTWEGLTGNPTAIGLFGPAPAGYAALAGAGLANPLATLSTSGLKIAGTSTGTFYVDGIKLKEEDLLNYLYYFSISTATYPTGEIRGQVKFQ